MATLNLTPTYSGYATTGPESFVQSNISGGYPRTQLDFVGGVSVVNLRFVLSMWQYQYWRAFFLNTISEGSLPFNIDLDIDGYNETYEVQIVQGSLNENQAYVRAKEVTFSVYAQPVIDEDYMSDSVDLFDAYGDEGENILPAIDQFANTDSQVLT